MIAFFLGFLFVLCSVEATHLHFSSTLKNPTSLSAALSFKLEPEEFLYKDLLHFSVDNPQLKVQAWNANIDTAWQYAPAFKETKKGYKKDFTITFDITATEPNQNGALHVVYYTSLHNNPIEQIFPITFTKPTNQQKAISPKKNPLKPQSTPIAEKQELDTSWSGYISNLLKKSDSLWIQLILVFILGLLLSLTPCIYPMIPITIGILQGQGSKSFAHNFLVAIAYTCGMATTFAIFGLLASCVGPLCGKLLIHPAFIIALVALLAYFALSMIGLYDMYIPKFMNKQNNMRGGSIVTSFLFGAASGTIASPCVSPGLALVLTIVATMGSSILGFLLLFTFGVGLSTPLLLAGTFSSSLNMMPSAGLWMVEVKRLFGFIMFGMCFYYLSYVTPIYILLWIMSAFAFVGGIFYLYSSGRLFGFWMRFNQLMGIIFIAGSLVLAFYAYKEQISRVVCSADTCWQTECDCAFKLAKAQNKKLFIDFWATFCPVCIAINKKVLTDPRIKTILEDKMIALKVDGTYDSNKAFAQLKDSYKITGFPVFLIVDPATGQVLQRWGAEIYDMDRQQLIDHLSSFI